MIHQTLDPTKPKGWFAGPWNSTLPIPVGYANEGVQDPHFHERAHEVYLVARGTSVALIQGERLALRAGDMLVVEPGEVHTFLTSSPDYFHFVLQVPFAPGDKVPVRSVP